MPQGNKVLCYNPDVWVYVQTDSGGIDVSADVISGQVQRLENSVSQCSFVINNRGMRYSNVIKPMDRITVFLKRLVKVQVFSGYINSAPFIDLYPTTATIVASCTLKRLQHTWFNPGLTPSQILLSQEQYASGQTDQGLGKMLVEVLAQVAQWDRDKIHVQQIPEAFINLAQTVVDMNAYDQGIAQLKQILGITGDTTSAAGVTTGGVGSSGSLTGNTNAQKCFNYFIQKGLSSWRAAGIIGNFMQESNCRPEAVEPNGVGHGIAQWSLGGRWSGVIALARQRNVQPTDLGTQLDFAWQELNGPYSSALVALQHAADVVSATQVFELRYEIAGTPNMAARIQYAQNALRDFGTVNGTAGAQGTGGGGQTSKPGSATSPPTLGTGSTTPAAGGTIPVYGGTASTQFLMNIYGHSAAEVEANLVTINFQGHQVQVHNLVAGAFQEVDREITNASTGYNFRTVGTYKWRNAQGPGVPAGHLSWHSFGIAMDINPDTNPFDSTNNFDIPQKVIDIFRQNGFGWGGDWSGMRDKMHFQFQGGNVPGSSSSGSSSDPNASSTPAYITGFFNVIFNLGDFADANAYSFTGRESLMDTQQLLPIVQAISRGGLRSFMSAPNGDFMAYYPDYFGIQSLSTKFVLEDIEMKDFSVAKNDDSFTTHVFAAGDTTSGFGTGFQNNSTAIWQLTSGIVTIEDKDVLKMMLNIDPDTDPNYKPSNIYAKYGARPLKIEFPAIKSPYLEFFEAFHVFMQKWSEQYATQVELTFMPELYPGMRLELAGHNLSVYVSQVTHNIDRAAGFSTTVVISSPSTTAGGIPGLPIAGGGNRQ